MKDDGLTTARGILFALLMTFVIWWTIGFAVLSVMHGWPYTPLMLAGICAIGVLIEENIR